MSKSLADLRASTAVKPEERIQPVCVAGLLVRRIYEIAAEQDSLHIERAQLLPRDEGGPQKPKRLGVGTPDRVKEIDTRMEALQVEAESLAPEIEAETGNLVLRALPSGEWRRFVNANPARTHEVDAETRVIERDARVSYGMCNSDALLDMLGDFVVGWNDEPLAKDDWEKVLSPAIAPGDLNRIGQIVVEMHEIPRDLPKLLSALRLTGASATA